MARTRIEDEVPGADAAQQYQEPLHVKYRPRTLKEVRGQDAMVRGLEKVLTALNRPHSYLFIGPSGCGKTTLARIVAQHIGASANNILEIDAATNTGIDAMRAITDTLHYQGFGGSAAKMVIIDEAHALSKAAWQSLLKVLEEPPRHVFFALCTTELAKVPETVQTRCVRCTVRELSKDDMLDLLEDVCKQEGMGDFDPSVLDIIVRRADGSPRKALTSLALVADAKSAKEAAILLEQPMESEELIGLLRAMVAGNLRWPEVVQFLSANRDADPESFRLLIVNYLAAVLLKAQGPKVVPLLDMLSRFSKPCNRSEKMAPLLLAFGDIVFPPK